VRQKFPVCKNIISKEKITMHGKSKYPRPAKLKVSTGLELISISL
jgi:hypothetical protein